MGYASTHGMSGKAPLVCGSAHVHPTLGSLVASQRPTPDDQRWPLLQRSHFAETLENSRQGSQARLSGGDVRLSVSVTTCESAIADGTITPGFRSVTVGEACWPAPQARSCGVKLDEGRKRDVKRMSEGPQELTPDEAVKICF
jgi:hypothetical protein